ncbi:5a1d9107-365e-4f9d-8236-acfb38a09c5e [Sclerotinia trifoliorum]|uniref:5a1d9107-365e-4f9d-8236-acfb38a09c5e n=1 Tax=Sclerotinia trifoliorum TaxID=28548 RepID=A0A8H2ZS57_9HELO|nr:5a1d9107-365e-4f9d-8236-acfb38a09c5e [Sclerotinia trifoliorum]
MIRTSDPIIQVTPPSPTEIDDDNKKHGKDTNCTHESTSSMDGHEETKRQFSIMIEKGFANFCWLIAYTPKRCRYDPESPPKFNMALNLLFAFACTFTVANLYYSHPILNILAEEFNVSNERASIIPTVMQAGYAAGLLFICPLGDIYKRRSFVLILIFCTATMWLGLCLTNSFPVFVGISFVAALTTVTPQLMLPLVGDLAPPDRRATCLAIVSSGLLLGLLVARLLSGILTQYTTWRTIYVRSSSPSKTSTKTSISTFTLLYLFMPDYPSTNPGTFHYLSTSTV